MNNHGSIWLKYRQDRTYYTGNWGHMWHGTDRLGYHNVLFSLVGGCGQNLTM